MNPVSLQLPLRANDTVLRLLRETDLPAFHAYRSDAALAVYQGWSPMSEAAALGFIQAMSGVSALVAGDWIQLGIADGRTDALAGDLGLYLDADGMAAEIGFTLASAHQGRGHATRAVAAALMLVFSSTTVRQVRAVTDARNQRSVRVLERAGFAKVGKREARFKGEPCTEHVYVRLRGQAGWPPSRTSLQRSADHRSVILDCLNVELSRGGGERHLWGQRSGHIPGAVNVPYLANIDPALATATAAEREQLLASGRSFKFSSPQVLATLYRTAGVTPDRAVITYCGRAYAGACGLLALRALGYENVRLYDGSWAEWSADPTLLRRFGAAASDCSACALPGQCPRNPKTKRGRQVARFEPRAVDAQHPSVRMRQAIDSPRGRALYSRRIATVEPVFANICHHKRMSRFTLRGKTKVVTQWQLYCLVHNIEKIATQALHPS